MFDPSAPHIIILLVVVLLLFGSTRLPGAAQALGKSMHIFKRSVKGLDDEDKDSTKIQATVVQPAQPLAAGTDQAQAAQLAELQKQVAELQRQAAGGGGAAGNGAAPANAAETAHGTTPSS